MEPFISTSTRVEMPTSVLTRCCTHLATCSTSAGAIAAMPGCSSQRTSTSSSRPLRSTCTWYWPESFSCCSTISSICVGKTLTPRMINMSSERPTILPMRRNDRDVGGSSRVRSRVR